MLANSVMPTGQTSKTRGNGEQWKTIIDKVQYYMGVQDVYDIPKNFSRLFAKMVCGELLNPLGNPCGIMLCGGTGNGKTHHLRFMQSNMAGMKGDNRHFITAADLVTKLRDKEGTVFFNETILTDYSFPKIEPTKHDYELIIDDLGAEPAVSHVYGELKDIIGTVITERYKAFVTYGHLTHFSSNLSEQEIERRYGERLSSRLHEMCVFVAMPDHDLRKEGVSSQ